MPSYLSASAHIWPPLCPAGESLLLMVFSQRPYLSSEALPSPFCLAVVHQFFIKPMDRIPNAPAKPSCLFSFSGSDILIYLSTKLCNVELRKCYLLHSPYPPNPMSSWPFPQYCCILLSLSTITTSITTISPVVPLSLSAIG